MLTFYFSGADGIMTEKEILTAGMVGKRLRLEFSEEWDELIKTVVFSNGRITLDRLYTGEDMVIPAQILEKPLKALTVGVYGVGGDGNLVIPTIRVRGPVILPGVEPAGDQGMDPSLPVWDQILVMIGQLENLETEETVSLVDAINELAAIGEIVGENGATFIPSVSAEGILSWNNDRNLENPEPVNIRGPKGDAGETPRVEVLNITGGHRVRFITNGLISFFDVMDGQDGEDGTTPLRGRDYWTEADKTEIKSYVDQAILGGAW